MNSENPFQREQPKQNIYYKCRVWNADEKGKCDGTGDYKLVVGDEYIWLSSNLSIPLDWITGIVELGPGFYIEWNNKLNDKIEVLCLCVRMLFLHNEYKRTEIITAIKKAIEKFNPTDTHDKNLEHKTCYECEQSEAQLFDYIVVTNYLTIFHQTIERILLCKNHAKKMFIYYYIRNFIFGFLGFSPAAANANINNAKMLFEKKAITSEEFKRYKTISRLRLFLLITVFLVFVVFALIS